MRRALFVTFLLLGLAIAWISSDLGNPEPSSNSAAIPERHGPINELRTPGHWLARGKDIRGNDFEGYLVVERAPEGYLRAGYFDWQTQIGGGRYHFEGTFDPGTRTVEWSGVNLQFRFGLATMARYRAVLSEDGKKFEAGSWSGGNSFPGSWTAESIGD